VDDKSQIQAVSQQISYSGPLPTASEFAGYDKTLPGAAERLLVMTEKQAEHRQKMDEKIVDKSLRLNGMGQITSFLICCIGFGIGVLFAFKGIETGAIASILGGISPIIIAALSNLKKK
jgi:uncharacterized membrane protein